MKITRQAGTFSIEELTLPRIIAIINALEQCERIEFNSAHGSQTLKGLKADYRKIKLREI